MVPMPANTLTRKLWCFCPCENTHGKLKFAAGLQETNQDFGVCDCQRVVYKVKINESVTVNAMVYVYIVVGCGAV